MEGRVILALLVTYLVGVECQAKSGGGEAVLVFSSEVYMCDDERSKTFADCAGLQAVRYNETCGFMTGYIEFFQTFDHATMLEIVVEKETSGRFEVVFTLEICDVCEQIQLVEKSDYYSYIKYFGLPEKCPFEPAKYQVHDLVADTSGIPINSANSGRYQVILNFYNNPDGDCKSGKSFIACMKMECLVE